MIAGPQMFQDEYIVNILLLIFMWHKHWISEWKLSNATDTHKSLYSAKSFKLTSVEINRNNI